MTIAIDTGFERSLAVNPRCLCCSRACCYHGLEIINKGQSWSAIKSIPSAHTRDAKNYLTMDEFAYANPFTIQTVQALVRARALYWSFTSLTARREDLNA